MGEEMDLNNPGDLIEMLIYLRYIELGGSDEDNDETDLGFNILVDNVYVVADGFGVENIGFKYNTYDKIIIDKSEAKIRQSVYDKVSKDFGEVINLIKNYLNDNQIKPLKDMYEKYIGEGGGE